MMARLLSDDERQAELIVRAGLAGLARRLAADSAARPSGEFRRRGRQALLTHLARTTSGRTQPLARRVVGLALAGLTLMVMGLPILIGPDLLAERARGVAGRVGWGQRYPVLSAEAEYLEAVVRPTAATGLVASPSPGVSGPVGSVATAGQPTPADAQSADPSPAAATATVPAPTRLPEAATEVTGPAGVARPPALMPMTPTTGVPPTVPEPSSPPPLVIASPTPRPTIVPPIQTPSPAVARPSPPAKAQPDEKEKPEPPRPTRPSGPPEPARTPRPDDEDDQDDEDQGQNEDAPEPTRTPRPSETRPPARTAEPSRTPRPAQTREPTKTPKPGD